MADSRTSPLVRPVVSVHTLAVRVTSGPDLDRACQTTAEGMTVGTAAGNDLVLTDPTVSRFHLRLVARGDGIEVVDLESTNGVLLGGVRLRSAVVPPGTVLALGASAIRVGPGRETTVEVHRDESLAGLRGRAPVMQRLMAQVLRAAQTDTAALIVGESGTGKEVVARALHELGPRRAGPFVVVDCGALLPTLMASELFGHERGAFTGADRQHTGAFEQAHGGTLLLDEIGELPPALQTTLLGVLERRSFRRLGGRAAIETDVRVIAATHRDLRGAINVGTFRLDLYYRLAVVVLEVPPLRARLEDLPLLIEHFLRESGHEGRAEDFVAPDLLARLRAHTWPGNVRELRNLVEATVAMGEPPPLSAMQSMDAAGAAAPGGDDWLTPVLALPYKDARATVLHGFEARYLRALLTRTADNVSEAAREARVARSFMNELLRRHTLR